MPENNKGFFKRWYEGMLNLSVEQQLQAKIFFFVGGAAGMLLATISFLMQKSWGLSIFLFCMAGLQVISAIGIRQQCIQYKKNMEEINGNNVDNELKDKINIGGN